MSSIISGSIKISGLGSDTDFASMIDQLEQIEMKHALQLDSWKSDWQTRLDAFKQVQAAMVEYSSILKEMNSVDKFMIKNVAVSNSAVCTATATGESDNVSHTVEVKQKATNSYAAVILNLSSKLDSVNTTGAEQKLNFTLGGNAIEVTVPPNCTLEGLKNLINSEFGSPTGDNPGMRATIIDLGNGQQMLQLYSTSTGEGTDITFVADPAGDFWGSTSMDIMDSTGWMETAGQNALVRIDGWPTGDTTIDTNWLSLSTNTLTHIPGVTINITGAGTSVIDVSLDTESIKANITKFVDATNELRTLMKELTDYNESAQTISSDYAESQFETQKGGVLMGNYGMQLMISKMKTYIFSKPPGFEYAVKDEYGQLTSGDLFSSLAHIGIKTDDEQGSATYGLLIFEDNIHMATTDGGTELITFDKALEMYAQGIGELFAADGIGTVDGYNFGYNNYVTGITKAGVYDVQYKADASGNIYDATVNGQAATWDSTTNQLTVTGDGDARGIVLDIYNNSETAAGEYHTGTVRIKEGFIPGLISMIDSDFLDPDSGTQDTKKGTLSILITQYQQVISNINDKIAKEDERLTLWRQRIEQRFANLEATLSYYSSLQTQLESQINSLSSSSS